MALSDSEAAVRELLEVVRKLVISAVVEVDIHMLVEDADLVRELAPCEVVSEVQFVSQRSVETHARPTKMQW